MVASTFTKIGWHVRFWLVKLAVWLLKVSGFYADYWSNWRAVFSYAENRGLHILPVHYYSPIPDTQKLSDGLWQQLQIPIGFDLAVVPALEWLERLSARYCNEYRQFPDEPDHDPHRFHLRNDAYRSGDAEILYTILREVKPRKIVEIGSGYSTLLISQAIRENQIEIPGYRCEFTAIEPYPPATLKPPPAEVTGLESRSLQQVPPELFSTLNQGDVLFIDSSHVARIGSDVITEYLRILPTLAGGVLVHIHDIFIPAEYPRWWIEQARFFWNEQYLLEAFLTYNKEFEVVMPTHAIWKLHNERFCKAIPCSEKGLHAPSSFWIRRHQPG